MDSGCGIAPFRAWSIPALTLSYAGEEGLYGGGEGRGLRAEIGGVPAGPAEVLVAGGTLLTVPALFVDQLDGSKQAEALDGEGDVREVGDGAVTVLEVKGIEELFGALGADLGERFLHGE